MVKSISAIPYLVASRKWSRAEQKAKIAFAKSFMTSSAATWWYTSVSSEIAPATLQILKCGNPRVFDF